MDDDLRQELARLTFIVEEVRATAAEFREQAEQWAKDVATGAYDRKLGEAHEATFASCAGRIEAVLQAAGDAEYRLHPARMLALHAGAARRLAVQIADREEAATLAAD